MTHEEMEKNLKNKVYENGRDFYQDLLELFGLPDSPLSVRMYSLAWQNGHAYGHREVYYHFQDLVEVFKG